MTTFTIAPETASNFLDVFGADDFSNDGSESFSLVQHRGEVSTGIVRQLQRLFSDTPSKWN